MWMREHHSAAGAIDSNKIGFYLSAIERLEHHSFNPHAPDGTVVLWPTKTPSSRSRC